MDLHIIVHLPKYIVVSVDTRLNTMLEVTAAYIIRIYFVFCFIYLTLSTYTKRYVSPEFYV